MKIVRDGKEIELTKDEIFKAYLEQESMYDIENIEENMSNFLSEDEYEILKDKETFISDAASLLRLNQDKYDMSYECALNDAFEQTKAKYLN